MSQAVLSGLASHLSNPYLQGFVAVDGWEILVGVHPGLGTSNGETKNESSEFTGWRPTSGHLCYRLQVRILLTPKALQSTFVIECDCH